MRACATTDRRHWTGRAFTTTTDDEGPGVGRSTVACKWRPVRWGCFPGTAGVRALRPGVLPLSMAMPTIRRRFHRCWNCCSTRWVRQGLNRRRRWRCHLRRHRLRRYPNGRNTNQNVQVNKTVLIQSLYKTWRTTTNAKFKTRKTLLERHWQTNVR